MLSTVYQCLLSEQKCWKKGLDEILKGAIKASVHHLYGFLHADIFSCRSSSLNTHLSNFSLIIADLSFSHLAHPAVMKHELCSVSTNSVAAGFVWQNNNCLEKSNVVRKDLICLYIYLFLISYLFNSFQLHPLEEKSACSGK